MMIHSGDKFSAINRMLRTHRLVPACLGANVALLLAFGLCPPALAGDPVSIEAVSAALGSGQQVTRDDHGEARARSGTAALSR